MNTSFSQVCEVHVPGFRGAALRRPGMTALQFKPTHQPGGPELQDRRGSSISAANRVPLWEEDGDGRPQRNCDRSPPEYRQDRRTGLFPALSRIAGRSEPVLGRTRQKAGLDQTLYENLQRLV